MIKNIFFAGICLFFIFLAYSFFESRWIKISRVEIHSRRLPKEFDGTSVVFLSDIHMGPFLSVERLEEIVERINRLQPDLIILGGDYIHYRREYIIPTFRALAHLKAPLGIYAVLGNHDHWADPLLSLSEMRKASIHSIDNNAYWIEKGSSRIRVGGVGDLWTAIQSPEKTLKGLSKDDFAIFVTHQPDYLEYVDLSHFDLTLSGHTHGGQITFFGLWAPILPSDFGQKYRYGQVVSGQTTSIISSGVGVVTVPFRFFCRPEIVSILLKKKN